MVESFPKSREEESIPNYHYNVIHKIITNNAELNAKVKPAEVAAINKAKNNFDGDFNKSCRNMAMKSEENWSEGQLKSNQSKFERLQKTLDRRNFQDLLSAKLRGTGESINTSTKEEKTLSIPDLCNQIAMLYWQIAVQILRKEVKKTAASVGAKVPAEMVNFGQLEVRYLPDSKEGLVGCVHDAWLADEEIKIEKIPTAEEGDEVGKKRTEKQHAKILMLAKQKVSAYFFGVSESMTEVRRLEINRFGDDKNIKSNPKAA